MDKPKKSNPGVTFDSREETIDVNAPLLIDATLSILHNSHPDRVNELAPRWNELMKSLRVSATLAQNELVFNQEALSGLDGAFFSDYRALFKERLEGQPDRVIFRNDYGCATGLAMAWLEMGGHGVVASFGGVGSLPAIEELLMTLHVTGKISMTGSAHPMRHLKELFEYMDAKRIPDFKAVTGRGIFAIESGVHVNALLKEPSLYEPFPPELVGARRYLGIGLHSGRESIRLKCDCLELPTSAAILKALLKKVKEKSLSLGRGLTDSEFEILHSSLKVPARPAKEKPPRERTAGDDVIHRPRGRALH
ncbi:MAG: hypothetical protein LBJ61_00930 [Deltaproteobacteria bacterium]|jgi:homocitrate synthase NifV|nr:hypothetical protein [Deltaproteobacteria bacterium]